MALSSICRMPRCASSPESAEVESIHEDRPVVAHLNRVAVTVGARAVQNAMGLDGGGIGVAVIDSGVTSWHDDLSYERNRRPGPRGQRVSAFVDFVNGRPSAYDDYGHGTHVAGIIAGNGYDTGGLRAGIAPAAQLVSLKVLDDQGQGTVSDVIAALEWAVANRSAYNIRVINLSVGAAVTRILPHRSPDACRQARGGRRHRRCLGGRQFGEAATGSRSTAASPRRATRPGCSLSAHPAPTARVTRTDDVVRALQLARPLGDRLQAKPDVVAPGTGIVSLSDPDEPFYSTRAANLSTAPCRPPTSRI